MDSSRILRILVILSFSSIFSIFSAFGTVVEREIRISNNKVENVLINSDKPPLALNRKIDLSVSNMALQGVLYAVASDTGLNLVMEDDVEKEQTFTAKFKNTKAIVVLESLCKKANLFFHVKDGTILVKKYVTKKYSIPYIQTRSSTNIQLGGDVLGGSGTNILGGYNLSYDGGKNSGDVFGQLEENMDSIINMNQDLKTSFTLNKFSGTFIVTGTRDIIEKTDLLVESLLMLISRQVLIEAKIVDVAYDRSKAYGVDWSNVADIANTTIKTAQHLKLSSSSTAEIQITGNNVTALLNALEQEGEVTVLSKPNIMALSGQTALITTGTITPYWSITSASRNDSSGQTDYTYEKNNVLDGIMFGVSPYIKDNGNIILNIIPISTSVSGTKQIQDNEGTIIGESPIIRIKEAGTIVEILPGELITIGGMVSNNDVTTVSSVPILSKIPLLGWFFKSESTEEIQSELVIFVQPRITTKNETQIYTTKTIF